MADSLSHIAEKTGLSLFVLYAISHSLSAPAIGYRPYAICYLLFTSLHTRSKSDLPPRFVDDHRHCVGEIEAPVSRNHGDTDTLLF